jgi:guanosine-3',5'-bis(diphosphate) 3'-pyrophosphohydrolase
MARKCVHRATPYFSHPLEVAGILTELKLDTASICTALLHDVVEDTGKPLSEIEKLFGKEIALLVDGVTKLGKLENQEKNVEQAENFRKLLLAMSEDIRVLLVKLADRLHNMRTMDASHPQRMTKRKRVSRWKHWKFMRRWPSASASTRSRKSWKICAFCHISTPKRARSISNRLSLLRSEGTGVVDKMHRILDGLTEASG